MSASARRSTSDTAAARTPSEGPRRPIPKELFKWLPLTFSRESDRLGCEEPAPTTSDEIHDQDAAPLTICDFRAILEEYTDDQLASFSYGMFRTMFARIVMALVRRPSFPVSPC